MDTVKKYCPNCSQLYVLNPSLPKGNNLPLFLTCGHTMCEKCIGNIVKFGEPIECKVCHLDMALEPDKVTLITQNHAMLYKFFPLNVHMIGELYVQNFKKPGEKTGSDNCFLDLKSLLKDVETTQSECLECHTPTSKMCEQCRIPLCDTCFNKTHKNFVIFKNHYLKNIAPVGIPNDCSVHKGKALDYYCKDCSKAVCMDCMMVGGANSCKNHNVVSIQEVNEETIEEISNISPKVDETFRRLTKTAVDIGQLLFNIENETQSFCPHTQMMADVEQYFSKLDCQLQKHKQELINLLSEYKSSERDSLVKAKTDVANAIKKAKTVLNTITASNDPKVLKEVNLSALLQNAKDVVDTPWYLSKSEEKDAPLKLNVNEEICNSISDYVRLEGKSSACYKLQSTKDFGEEDIPAAPPAPVMPPELPRDVRQSNKAKQEKKTPPAKSQAQQQPQQPQQPPPYVAFYKNVPHYRSKSESVTSLNSLSSESSYRSSVACSEFSSNRPMVQQVSPFPESRHPKPILEGSQELIYISHIVDPHNFFVQRSCHQSLVKEMIRAFRNAMSLPKPNLNHIAREKVYLVYNKADNMWQRCRVINIDRKDVNKPVFHVFCFDFGSTEKVTVEDLRLIPPARLQSPEQLAINCSLANCVPKTGSWTSDDSYLIRNIIDNKQAVINVRQIIPVSQYSFKVDCDVITFEDGVSLAHALVFHDRARLINPRLQYPRIEGISERPKIFMNNNDLKYKMVEEVIIINIVSPDKFFVRKKHLQDVYEKLCEDLDQEYSLSDDAGTIYLPEVGMFCVVNLDRHSEVAGAVGWARCLITETPGRGRVRVLLVDSGAVLLVHWKALRRIHHKFSTLRALAIECHLAGVTPLNKKWNPRSVALLQQFTDTVLEMKVEDNRNRNSVGVSLYDKRDEEPVCINQEMIRHKYAVSFGIYSFNSNPVVDDQAITNRAPVEKKPKPQKKATNTVTILQKETSPQKKVNEKDLEAKDKGPVSLEAKILHYQSPSLIYISLIQQQQVFNELFEKIQKHYSTKKPPGKEGWKVGDRCCTICKASQTWRRGLIIEIEGSNAKIFYSDFACVETVPIANLCELAPEFASIGDAAIKCHLSGVVPAVGDEWPSLTKEFLKELLDAYKRIFITKVGHFKDKSMPIQIWVYHVIQGGALEPDKSEWRCLNQRIIEQGLGVPDKSQEVPATEQAAGADSDMLSFLNVTGSVMEWLQLEPLPTKPNQSKASSSNTSTPVAAEEDQDETPSSSNTLFITDWLPAEPLACKEFTGIPTYVDNDGVIYLHDISQEDTLDLIRKALDVRFKDPDPKAKYAKWSVGEPCIAMYYLDNKFYRGRVLEVCNESSNCLIHYIDYGNEELCSFENLRKSIALYQVPVQAHKCVLNRIKPAGERWDRLALDYIHKSIVEKHCYVKITGEPVNGILPVDLKYDKLWINDHLVEFEMAKYTDGSKVKVPKFMSQTQQVVESLTVESDSGPDYIVAEEDDTPAPTSSTSYDSFNMESMEGKDWNKILEEEEDLNKSIESFITYSKDSSSEFLCNITVINDVNQFELNVIHDDETALIYEQLYEDINNSGENMSPLNGIFENKACIAIFQEDQRWYRAMILQYSEAKNQIKVRYVDYGNVAVISLADVREIDEEWAKLPPATIAARLHAVRVNPDIDISLVATEYTNVFLDKGPFTAKIISYEDSIPLVELRNENGLPYEDLIEKGIFLRV